MWTKPILRGQPCPFCMRAKIIEVHKKDLPNNRGYYVCKTLYRSLFKEDGEIKSSTKKHNISDVDKWTGQTFGILGAIEFEVEPEEDNEFGKVSP